MMVFITAIRRNGKLYEIEVDGAPFLRMRSAVFRTLALREGDAMDVESFCAQSLPEAEYEPALAAAVAYLASRARTIREMRQRLERAGYHEPAIVRVMERLEELGYLGDADFANSWVESRGARAIGKRRIKQEMLQKGVDALQVEEALEQMDPALEREKAAQLARKLAGKHADEPERACKQKVIQALIRRGFDYEQAVQAYKDAGISEEF